MNTGDNVAWKYVADTERLRDGRMLKWLRRQVHADLRAAWADRRSQAGERPAMFGVDQVADRIERAKAMQRLLATAEGWCAAGEDWPHAIRSEMELQRGLVMALMRRIASGYRLRPGWRDEWDAR